MLQVPLAQAAADLPFREVYWNIIHPHLKVYLPLAIALIVFGYGVVRRIRMWRMGRSIQRTDGVVGLDDAALYQALHRLAAKRFVEAEWGLSENNRRAKYYRLTRKGHRQLDKTSDEWRRYADAVLKVLDH